MHFARGELSEENFMKLIEVLLTTTFLIFTVIAAPAKAELLVNEWQEFAFPVTDDYGCAGEDGVASGVVHTRISDLRMGDVAFQINAKGIWKGDDSGVEFLWKDNITEVVPVDIGDHFVVTFSQNLRIIGQGLGFRVNANVHITEVGGELVVYFNEFTIVCNA